MDSLENIANLPFELGKYEYNLNWKWLKVGNATLTISKTKKQDLPEQAKKVYETGSLYKIVFEGTINVPILRLIAEKGTFTTYTTIQNQQVKPLLSISQTKILRKESTDTTIYNPQKSTITINTQTHKINEQKMQTLRDPASHVIQLLFTPKNQEEEHFCGHYNDLTGNLYKLILKYTKQKDEIIGTTKIPAHTYFLDTDINLELPYTFDTQKNMHIPSLKQKIAIIHKILGKITLEYTQFKKN